MKFAVFKYAAREEDISVNKFIKKLPKAIVEMYIEKKNPYTYSQEKILEAEGFEVTLPFTKEFAQKDYFRAESLLKRAMDDFYIKDVGIAVVPEGMEFQEGMRKSYGRALMGLYVDEIVKKIADKKNLDMKNLNVLLVDGDNFISKLATDQIYEEINYFSIYTTDVSEAEHKAQAIQEETGLNVNIIQSIKNSSFKEADVIINCGLDMENTDYFFKKGAIYIDLAQNKQKLKRMMEKRDDITMVDGVSFKTEYGNFGADILEAAWFVSKPELKKFLVREYDQSLQQSLSRELKSENCSICKFYRMGKEIRIK